MYLSILIGEQENSSGHQKPSNVLSAAQTLAMALQQCSITPSPDTRTAEIINSWLENYMPVSRFSLCLFFNLFARIILRQ